MTGDARRSARARPHRALLVGALLVVPLPLAAHPGRPPEPHDLWTAWSFDPAVVCTLLVTAWLYAWGIRALWRQAGAGRGVRTWEAWTFGAGWVMLALALVSPLHALGGALFSAHMVQHELLVALAAPLLVLGSPGVATLWALPPAARRRVGAFARRRTVRTAWRVATLPLAATALHGVALWAWHAPRAYEATLRSEAVHAAQHASFLGTAVLFWWAVLHARGRRGAPGGGVFWLFVTVMHTGALGALLTLASRPWYPDYAPWTRAWGLTPLEDQQLGGLVMWVPGGLAYVVAALALVARWLRDGDPPGTHRRPLPPPALSWDNSA